MRYLYLIMTIIIIFTPRSAKAERELLVNLQQIEVVNAKIDSPVAGQVVQGAVVIRGNSTVNGFQSLEVDFAYLSDPTQTWFLIQESISPVQDGILAVWDTTTITDGNYNLRLLIKQIDGNQIEVSITGLRVRNYTPIETETPAPIPPQVTPVPGVPTFTATPQATPSPSVTPQAPTNTPLPANPAMISASQVMLTFGKGAAFTIGSFAIVGAYIILRTFLHNRKW